MRPLWGFLSLGMRDVQDSPPPVPEDARRRAVNRAHAEAQKKQKDAKVAKRTRKILAHEELEKRRRRQRDDESEVGRGPLDHLPDVGEMVPRASASSPALLGGGAEGTPGPAIARPGAEADTPEAQALGKRAVSLVGSTAEVEQAVSEATYGGAPLAPLKALKVSPGSTAHWVAEVQATMQRGAASARADLKKSVAQGGVAEVTPTQTREGAPPPHEAEARELDGAEAPSVAEATKVEAPRASEAEATEAGAPKTAEATAAAGAGAPGTTEATMAEAGAPGTTEATMVEAGAPGTTEADMIAVKSSAQEVEMKAAEASVAPLVQGLPLLREGAQEAEVHPISSDDTSQA
ncbi:uncharacterized protein [Miscanthus floridulus]|uniref:uncharacterized protein n=1 Tax=Miscanthus floridulus TaxID=154761 RepID=UPI0034582325